MNRKRFARAFIAAVAVAAGLATGQPPAMAAPVVDQTIAGPFGGVEVCAVDQCREVEGISNLHILVDVTTESLTPPTVTTGTVPGCTGNVNLAVFVTTVDSDGGSATVIVEFDRTDKNGNVIDHEIVGGVGGVSVPLPEVEGVTTQLVSVCGSLL